MKIQNLFLLLFVSLACGAGALYFFPRVYPLISLNIFMSRQEALDAAHTVIQCKNLSIGSHHVVTFESDEDVKIYTAFAGQGKDDELMMLEQDLYQTYKWQVRFFEEKNIHETAILFTPAGKLYGYKTILSENDVLPEITKEQAQQLVELELQSIVTHFPDYSCVEYSQYTQPCGRIDHTFVYERKDIKLHEAFYRCNAVVAGNKIIECLQFIKIPEKFNHEYHEARAANSMLATIGFLIVYGLYLLLFTLFALYVFMQKRRLIFNWPLRYAAFVSLGVGFFAELNQYQLWFSVYCTEFAISLFLTEKIISLCLNTGFIFALLCVVSLSAEALTRAVYGKQVQLWKMFTKQYWYSRQAVEHIFVGYIFLGFFLSYEVFYIYIFPFLGIKSPTDSLMDPNILAHYIPSFAPLMNAFFAGTWEEMVCRAIPIAFLMWWAERKKYSAKQRWYMFIFAFILQAVVFGILHATYPQQPSYARVLELIPDSIGFGIVYVYFGLVPGMMAHFLYDLLMMSLPIFASSDLLLHQIFIGICLTAPLVWALYVVAGKEQSVPQSFLNESWKPQEEKAVEVENPYYSFACFRYPQKSFVWAVIFGLCGIYSCIHYPWQLYTARLEVTKEQAVCQARTYIEKRFSISLDGWDVQVQAVSDDVHNLEFVWHQEPALFQKYAQVFSGPFWKVRYVHFDADLVARQEQYEVFVGPTLNDVFVKKYIPESFSKCSITQEEALLKAQEYLVCTYCKQPEDFELMSVQNVQMPARADWEMIFKDHTFPVLKNAYVQRVVYCAGDEITQDSVQIKVPQDWFRDLIEYKALWGILYKILEFFVFVLLALFLLSFLFFYRSFMYRWVMQNYVYVLSGFLLSVINVLPYAYSACNTVEPIVLQMMKLLFSVVISRFFFFAYLELVSASLMVCRADTSLSADIFLGLGYGLGLGGVFLYIHHAFKPLFLMYEETFTAYSMYVPYASLVYFYVLPILHLIMMLYVLGLLSRTVSKKYSFISVLGLSMLFGTYIAFKLFAFSLIETVYAGAVFAGVLYILYHVILSVHPGLSAFIGTVAYCVCIVSSGCTQYAPHAFMYHSMAALMIVSMLLLYFNHQVDLQSEN